MGTPLLQSHVKKNKKPTRFHGFQTFADPGVPVSFSGAFRDNIIQFLEQCAEPEDYRLEGMPIWSTFLVYERKGTVLPLYTVEEDAKHSNTPFCDYCRCSGWSHHFVSRRKYHFIIPGNDEWNSPLVDGAFDLQSHLLHGLIHGNGFGHLICINGIEGGSKYICGREIMDFWDRICTALHVRKITVEDSSKRNEMELRLLYGIAYGNSWFNRWGYRFCHGSFGVKEHNYDRAMNVLSSTELDQVINHFRVTDKWMQIKQMIHHYREMSETSLITLRDLFSFMLTLKPFSQEAPRYSVGLSQPELKCPLNLSKTFVSKGKHTKIKKFSSVVANLDSRWPVRRLETTAQVIVEALKQKRAENCLNKCGMTRQEVRDAARLHIGDTGLIDHVLKVMNNVIIGNFIIQRSVNRSTKVLEYTIQELKDMKELYHLNSNNTNKYPDITQVSPGRNVSFDLSYLYQNMLLQYLRFICRLTVSCMNVDGDIFADFPVPPWEYIVVPLYSTVGDLKMAVQKALQDTYCVMEKLEVVEILGLEEMQESEVVLGICESGKEIWVRVLGLDMEKGLIYEAGMEKWSVKCKCGAKDDDGERMMACDICETWQHTKCCGIKDNESVPRLFVCETCCSSLAPTHKFADDFLRPFLPQPACISSSH